MTEEQHLPPPPNGDTRRLRKWFCSGCAVAFFVLLIGDHFGLLAKAVDWRLFAFLGGMAIFGIDATWKQLETTLEVLGRMKGPSK